ALTFLPLMEADAVAPDLVLFSNLIHLAPPRRRRAQGARALLPPPRRGIRPDLKAYNAAIAAYCKSDLLRDAKRLLLHDVPADGVAPDAESYAPVLAALARRGRHSRRSRSSRTCAPWRASSPTSPSSTSCSTRTGSWTSRATPTGSSGPCAGPVCRRASARTTPCSACTATPGCSGRRSTYSASCAAPPSPSDGGSNGAVRPNVMTYIQHHDRHPRQGAGGRQGQEPGAANTGRRHQAQRRHLLHRPVHLVEGREELDRAAKLFEKLRESGTEMDPVLYQTIVVAYERAGLVSQSKRPLRELRDPDQAIPKDTTMKQRRAGGGGRVAV
ncbi:hypothetical protein CFC21_080493, partial [Triticum aestivum]